MGVNLGRRDVRVPEQFLDHSKVGSSTKKMGGETVTKLMGVDVAQSGTLCIAVNDLPDRDTFEWFPQTRQQESVLSLVPAAFQQFGAQRFEVRIPLRPSPVCRWARFVASHPSP